MVASSALCSPLFAGPRPRYFLLLITHISPHHTTQPPHPPHPQARHIANLAALQQALSALPNVRVTSQDFALLPFAAQVSLAHSAGVFVSVHGAGTAHGIFHAALGAPNCCALVELQPDHTLGYQNTQGYANLARLHGLHYYRYEASDGRTGPKGTTLDVGEVAELVRRAVAAVRTTPTCLHDARDTSSPLTLFNDS